MMEERVIETASPEETFALGVRMGETARPGEIYTLIEPILSPTFTILQVYEQGRMPFYHFDVYRIGDPEEMEEIGYEDCFYGSGLTLIEWGGLIEELIPRQHTEIRIEKDLQKGFDYRKITICEVA